MNYRVDPVVPDGYVAKRQQRGDLAWEVALKKAASLSMRKNDAGQPRYEYVEVRDEEIGRVMAVFAGGERVAR